MSGPWLSAPKQLDQKYESVSFNPNDRSEMTREGDGQRKEGFREETAKPCDLDPFVGALAATECRCDASETGQGDRDLRDQSECGFRVDDFSSSRPIRVSALARAKEILEDDTRVFKKISCIALLGMQRMPSDDERQVEKGPYATIGRANGRDRVNRVADREFKQRFPYHRQVLL